MGLRVAHVNSVSIRVPPRSHGGTEWVAYHLVEGLHRRGHRVALFASGDSSVSCTLRSVTDRALLDRDDWSVYLERDYEAMSTRELQRAAAGFDLVHAHWPTLAPYFWRPEDPPLVVTYQYVARDLLDYYERVCGRLHGVFVSAAQARSVGRPDATVIHNAVDTGRIAVGAGDDDSFVIVGRMTPRKGIAEAIRVARRAGVRLIIVGPQVPNLRESRPYFERHIAPHIDGDRVRYIPELPNREVTELVGRCRGFLFPIQWEEPFGMVVAEALAVGTPVIALRRGAMPELIRHGTTGFLCDDEDAMVDAVGRIGEIDRAACRSEAEQRFDVERLLDDYERLYAEVLERAAPRPPAGESTNGVDEGIV